MGSGGDDSPAPPRAQDDLYRHVNASWLAANPVPPEYGRWGTFEALNDAALEHARLTMEADVGGKAGAWLASGMNAASQDALAALAPTLAIARRLADASGPDGDPTRASAAVAELHASGATCLFSFGDTPDKKNSEWSIAGIAQGGVGLPDRDYYHSDAADRVEIRAKYEAHVARVLALLGAENGFDPEDAAVKNKTLAAGVVALETRVSSAHLTPAERRDAERTYNKFASVDELPTDPARRWSWRAYFDALGKPEPGAANVSCPAALVVALDAIVGDASEWLPAALVAKAPDAVDANAFGRDVVFAYAAFHVASGAASYLTDAFVEEDFAFFGRELGGQKALKPRWKRVVAHANGSIGELVGKKYVERHFPASAKDAAKRLVACVTRAVEERLRDLPWMSDATRRRALEKMRGFAVKIGYPDEWIDYADLALNASAPYYANALAADRFEFRRVLRRIDAPVDRSRWFMAPQQVNAYYHPMLNEIVFPAAILQPPFFDATVDPAINFGGIGAVIGHEITHGFDDQGRKYDAEGNMNDWWAPEDAAEFTKRSRVMVEQAAATVVHQQDDACQERNKGPFSMTKRVATRQCACRAVDGELTQGENIADLGGLRLAYRAWEMMRAEGGAEPARVGTTEELSAPENFPPESERRFFFSWATVWRQNITAKLAAKYIAVDPHAPPEVRVNGTVSNMPEFVRAFGVEKTDALWRDAEGRVDIW